MKKKNIISILSVIVNLLLALGKLIIGVVSRSASIIADGINSGTDVIASTIGFIGIKASEKPADKEHPYGHGKAEVISGFVITLIILTSSLFIIYDALRGFFYPEKLNINYIAFSVMGFSALANLIMSQIKIRAGKRYDSVTLITDGVHSKIDFLVSAAIFLGLFFVNKFDYVDSALALLVGVYIFKESLELGKTTTDSLIGQSAGEDIEKKITDIVKENKISLESLRTQKMGVKIFAELKIKLSSKFKVDEANNITKKLEKELTKNIRNLEYVSIQISSHNIGRGYYKSRFGRNFEWQSSKKMPHGKGFGPEGECFCQNCGKTITHKRGVPCYKVKCPECGKFMTRKGDKK